MRISFFRFSPFASGNDPYLVITKKDPITGKSQILEPAERKGGKSFGNGNGRDRGDRRDSREDRPSKKEDSAPKAESKTESE